VETRESLLGLQQIEETVNTWIRTGELGRSLDAAGKAQQVDAEVYSTDKYFQKMPGLRLYRPARNQDGTRRWKLFAGRDCRSRWRQLR
jgi:hypothetical protein